MVNEFQWRIQGAMASPNFSFVTETFGFVVVLSAFTRQIEKLPTSNISFGYAPDGF